ncbi:MAG: CpaF family protein [Chloroflexales bacterium]|nr:CpaF family protein [Chloroflexales bacterium]
MSAEHTPSDAKIQELGRTILALWLQEFDLAPSPELAGDQGARRSAIAARARERWGVEAAATIETELGAYLAASDLALTADERTQLGNLLAGEILDQSPLERWLADESISEIMLNGHRQVYIWHKSGRVQLHSPYASEDELMGAINDLLRPLGQLLDEANPIVSTRLPDGTTVVAIARPISLVGPSLTITKLPRHRLTIKDLIRLGSLTEVMAELLTTCVRARLNILVAGNMASGKTTLLNVIAGLISADERIVTVDEVAQYQISHEHLVALESRPADSQGKGAVSVRELLQVAARMRPEWIIAGELNGPEAFDLLRIVEFGHTTITLSRAESAEDALERLEMMIKFYNPQLPVPYLRMLISSSIDLVIQQSRLPDGSRRLIEICELLPLRDGAFQLNPLFRFQETGTDERKRITGTYITRPMSARLARRIETQGLTLPPEVWPGQPAEG